MYSSGVSWNSRPPMVKAIVGSLCTFEHLTIAGPPKSSRPHSCCTSCRRPKAERGSPVKKGEGGHVVHLTMARLQNQAGTTHSPLQFLQWSGCCAVPA
jgi:hypothetical protein